MGWKTINGRRGYYKSERVGGRVKSTNFGAGEAGTLIASMVAFEQGGNWCHFTPKTMNWH